MTFFEVAKEVTKYLGFFCYKLCHLDIPKIAQTGHTDSQLPSVSVRFGPKQQIHELNFECFFKKMGQPGLFFVYFRSYQTNFTIFTTNNCEKCPSSIRRRESNPRPLVRESLPLTTRPGLIFECWAIKKDMKEFEKHSNLNSLTPQEAPIEKLYQIPCLKMSPFVSHFWIKKTERFCKYLKNCFAFRQLWGTKSFFRRYKWESKGSVPTYLPIVGEI